MTRDQSNQSDLLRRRNAAVPRGPFNVAPIFASRAEGARIWDIAGREYIDFCGGIGTLNVGHNHPRVVGAIRRQIESFVHTCWHVAMYEPYVRLAERLNEIVPIPGPNKTVLFNSGAEAVENAVKIARVYTKRPAVMAFERGFHGRTLLAMTLTGKVEPYTKGFGPFAPEVYRLPLDPFYAPDEETVAPRIVSRAKEALDRLFRYQVPAEDVACVIMEPVLGEGGFYPVHPLAVGVLEDVCRHNGILFVSDEVQTGFGRCGARFACERYGIVPDMITMAKSLAGGLPLSAVTGRADIMDAPPVGGIGGTFAGNPVACAAANAVLDVMEDEDLPGRARHIGEQVMRAFEDLARGHDHVGAVRGLGAMCGLEIIDPGTGGPDPARVGRILEAARADGLLAMPASGNIIRTLMPLTIRDDDLVRGLDVLSRAVAASG